MRSARRVITALGRILPREIRERIYEPARDDLAWARAHRKNERSDRRDDLHHVLILCESMIYAVPAAIRVRGRFTWLGRFALAALVVFGLYLVVTLTAWWVYMPTPGSS